MQNINLQQTLCKDLKHPFMTLWEVTFVLNKNVNPNHQLPLWDNLTSNLT